MMQIREMKSEKSQVEYLRNLQESVKGMVKSKGSVPDAALDAVAEITKYLNQTLGFLGAERATDETSEGNIIKAFTDAKTAYESQIEIIEDAGADSKSSKASSAASTHGVCRVAESGLYANWDACVTEQNSLQDTFDNKVDNVHSKQSAVEDIACSATKEGIATYTSSDVDDVDAYSTAITAMITARGKLDAKKLQCAANKTALDTKRDNQDPKGCNQLQHDMEIAQCSYASAVQTEVNDYGLLYGAAEATYDADVPGLNDNSDNRFQQCQIIKKVQCYVQALEDFDDDTQLSGAVVTCDGENHETACGAYQLSPRAKPARETMMAIPDTYCATLSYGTWPDNTQRGAQNCPCST